MWPFNSSLSISKPLQPQPSLHLVIEEEAPNPSSNTAQSNINTITQNSIDLLLNQLQNNKKTFFSFTFTDQQQNTLKSHCQQPIAVQQVQSDEEYETYKKEEQTCERKDNEKESEDILLTLLRSKNIDQKYVRCLFRRQMMQIKSCRRLKVQRYLQKRRMKTWSRKICYNCRQKVAQQRLRVKGKFIKKRKAMEILGITKPIQISNLKHRLQQYIQDKPQLQLLKIMQQLSN